MTRPSDPLPAAAPVRTRLGAALLAIVAVTPPALAQPGADGLDAADAAGAMTLDQVVVTAAGFEQKIVDAPASISVIDREEIRKRPYTSLVDVLRDIEGVDVGMESTDKNGMATVSIRGMPSDYTLVLIDGRRQSNVGAIYPNNFGGGQFAFMPPLDAIERIEVVRGPMSTLYGSDAMGGVINIITRKVADRWHGSATQGFTFQQDDQFGDERTTDVYANGPLVPDLLGLAVRGSHYDRDASNPEWEPFPLPDGTLWERTLGFGAGGRAVAAENWTGGFRLSFTPNEDHDVMFDYDVSRQKFDNTEGQTGTLDGIESLWRSAVATIPNPDHDPTDPESPATIDRRVVQPRVGYTEYQRYERDQMALTHLGRWGFADSETSLTRFTSNNLGRSLPLTVEERADLQDLWNDVCARRGLDPYCNNAGGGFGLADLDDGELDRLNAFLPRALRVLELDGVVFDTKFDFDLGPHYLSVGGQFNDTDMEDGVFGMYGDGFREGTVQKHRQWALFAEDNWGLTDTLTATLGVRYDDHNIFGSHVSPRAYLVWTASPQWTVKGGVSTGYKTPRPDQLFPGITGFGGQGVSPFVGTPDLQPETSTNYELAAYYDNLDGFTFNATVFANRFKDKIATADAVPNCEIAPPGTDCVDVGPGWAALGYRTFSQANNIDDAETQGVELAARWEFLDDFALRGNYTFTDSEQKSGAAVGQPIAGYPARHMFNAVLDWQATDALTLSLSGESRSKRFRSYNVETETASYYEDYQLFHLGASWQASDWLTINGRINNLLDKDFISQTCVLAASQTEYECLDDYLIKDKRRSFWLSANVRF
jgi:outer membrane receptor for ferrienterochelin and colicins